MVDIFCIRSAGGSPPKAPVSRAADALGYKDVELFRRLVAQWWPAWDKEREEPVSAAELVALIHMLQFKTAAAAKLAKELMEGGVVNVVRLPTEALRGLPDEDTSGHEPATPSRGGAQPATPSESGRGPQKDEPCRSLAFGADLPWVACDPEDVGMDREPLEKCRRYLSYRVGRKHFAGLVQGVVKNGKLVHFHEAGYADIEKKTPMRQDTLIRLFSMTKCIVAVAFLTYAEDPAYGIDLEDPVWKYIPSFKNLKIAAKRGSEKLRQIESRMFEEKQPDGKVKKVKLPTQPTLRQLLTHTAGLGYGATLGDSWPPTDKDHYKIYGDLLDRSAKKEIKSIEEWVDELAKVPLKVHPGSYWEYSFSTDVLGRVIEVVSGKTLDQAVEERVCGPLGMIDTTFEVPPEKAHRIGGWYEKKPPVDEKGEPLEKVSSGATWNFECIDPGGEKCGWVGDRCSRILSGGGTIEVPVVINGGMVSTFRDYLRFLLMIRNFGDLDGVRVLRRETVQTMICNQVPASTGRRAAWVFDKKGQGYNFVGQIQVQHNEKDTFQEKGELKRGNQTYASLTPGTVSSEFGWGGLGGPAWTIDPRSDLIVLSMTQTAFELDHEENLRFSARKAIHAGIFGETMGSAKVTDCPPEFHEGKRGGKLRPKEPKLIEQRRVPFVSAKPVTEGPQYRLVTTMPRHMYEAELKTFMEAEEEATLRQKTLKELSIARGNAGHEVEEDDDMESLDGGKSVDSALLQNTAEEPAVLGSAPPAARSPPSGPSPSTENGKGANRVLRQSSSSSSEKEVVGSTPDGQKRLRSRAEGDEAAPKAKVPRSVKKEKEDRVNSPTRQVAAVASPSKPSTHVAQQPAGVSLFARVSVKTDACADGAKVSARVTGVEGDELEVITEGQYRTLNVGMDDVSLIDETQFVLSSARGVLSGPSDFSFLMEKEGMLPTAPGANNL